MNSQLASDQMIIKKKLAKMEVTKGFVNIPIKYRQEIFKDIDLPYKVTVNGAEGRIDSKGRIWARSLKSRYSKGDTVEILRAANSFQIRPSVDLPKEKQSYYAPRKSLVQSPQKKETKSQQVRAGFNGLSPREWTRLSKSVWAAREVSSAREWYHLKHGATFSVALAERAMRMFTKQGDLVLDPFLGVGTTLVAAKNLGRKGIGVELYEEFVKFAKEALSQQKLVEGTEQRVILGDCRDLLQWVAPSSVQLMFTSPPYANFISRSLNDRKKTHKTSWLVSLNKSVVRQYGEDSRDFGNLPYEGFLEAVKEVMRKLFVVTKPGGYNIWVVKDCRNPQIGKPLIDFHSDIAHLGEAAGFLYHDLIVWDQNEQRSLVLLGYPSVFYVNINHTFLVVLRKPPENGRFPNAIA
jgi:DNA modification methylase